MPKFVCEYKYTNRFNVEHSWTCISRLGALHLHIGEIKKEKGFIEYHGGLETHFRSAPDYMKDDAPSHEKCWLIGGPCWHDGTSLYVQENVIPYWLIDKYNHERMFEFLKHEYKERFSGEAKS